MTPFMLWPWLAVTVWCGLLTLYLQFFNPDLIHHYFDLSSDVHTVMGGALAFLIVFRTNSSYDRWWEARCTWQTVVTTCRSYAVMNWMCVSAVSAMEWPETCEGARLTLSLEAIVT